MCPSEYTIQNDMNKLILLPYLWYSNKTWRQAVFCSFSTSLSKQWPKLSWGRGRLFYFAGLSRREAKDRTWRQKLKVETKAERCSLNCSNCTYSVFYRTQYYFTGLANSAVGLFPSHYSSVKTMTHWPAHRPLGWKPVAKWL